MALLSVHTIREGHHYSRRSWRGEDHRGVADHCKVNKRRRERGAEEILNDMQLLVGPPELRYIQNVAIMMFCEHPEKFFGYTYVQMTSFPKGSVENPSISEDFPNITGSVLQMIQATMERFRNLIIREKVIKVPNQMEALRIFNYPYQAIEEAVVNAFYHRDYMSFEPVRGELVYVSLMALTITESVSGSYIPNRLQVFLGLLFAYWHYIICKSENQYTDKWEIEKKNILFFWNKKCECILKPMRFSRLVKCGRIHIENTNERLSR